MFLGYYSTLLINLEKNSTYFLGREKLVYQYIAGDGKLRIIGYFLLQYVEQKNMLQDVL